MRKIEKSITTKQIIYELTKEELESIKAEERKKGQFDVISYIGFCWNNFIWKKNIAGVHEFVDSLLDFLNGYSGIKNTQNIDFSEYVSKGE